MILKSKIQNLHHAYILEGESEQMSLELKDFLETIGINTLGNPDFSIERFSNFDVENARDFKNKVSNKSFSQKNDAKKVFIISVNFINHEAEQALLKTLEEPTENTYIFLILPDAEKVAETIRSRCEIIYFRVNGSNENTKGNTDAKKFLNSTLAQRLDYIKTLVESHKKDEDSGILKQEAISLLNNLESLVRQDLTSANIEFIKNLWRLRDLISDRGASTKTILEAVAIALPK